MFLKYLKKFAVSALLGITLLAAPAHAAGTIPLALAIQLDTDGSVAANCQATFFRAGTPSSKQNVYADFSLTQQLANPLSCDQSGRLPMFWIADGLIHVRLTNSSGNPIVDTTMQVLGPSSGGGGGGSTVDPTAIMATGDMKARYGTGPLSGFVRANGLTIGNGASGASERANADTQALFVYLCSTDANLVMTPARSGNCLNDYNASKQLAVPDWRGRALAFLDDMGNSAAGRLTASYFGTTATILGAAGGAESLTLTAAQLPSITSTGNNVITVTGPNTGFAVVDGLPGVGAASNGLNLNKTNLMQMSGTNAISVTSSNTSGAAHRTVQPTMLATIYLKL
ncbi:hypothetical protein PMI42_06246 [Bradyrhizobium sp. YR681]|uniref:hypothetical protein n=1 Tax=Bradyrhizobium sp. YR681 TaxID=1144344 RepID=UPI00026FB9FC|nr:hypothetical protein [Bradyrhizobium sp. YR681]EJN10470.1 hypothetical protein PMI42_06246 [Bradyrhizobium sp. YR681]